LKSASIVVAGVNHKTAPVSLLERLTIGTHELSKALHQLATYEHVLEGVILSTCNRVEVYAVVSRFHAGSQDIRNFLAEFRHVAPEDFADHLYTYHDEAAVRHLFRVAAGIDSMVLGESEILGQVRRSFQAASEEDLVHRMLGAAFRQALRVGKRARTETAIGRNPVSVSSAAVDLARRAFTAGDLSGKRVAIVGAGKMGRLAAQALAAAGARDVVVVNRTEERASELAEMFGAESRPLEALEGSIAAADMVICSTTAPETVLDASTIENVMADRPDRPMFIVDIAVPRDVDPAAGEIEGVVLRDIDDLKSVVENSRGSRLGEVANVEAIIAAELDHFTEWERSAEFAPTAADLVERAENIRIVELERARRQLGDLSAEQLDAIDHVTRRIVAKLLHTPLKKAKGSATSKQGNVYLAALRELFALDDDSSD